MTTRWLDALFSTRPELRPTRALLTPAWLGALAVLGLNDHLFKGSGALPGALTGKLSDVAGMIVAPALLAALLGVRSRRGLFLCTAAVGLVFSLINLSPACADAWSWLMGLVGFPWAITVDPTDLLALPAGARLRLGPEAVVEVTGLRNPCAQLDAPELARQQRWSHPDVVGALGEHVPDDHCKLPGGRHCCDMLAATRRDTLEECTQGTR